MAFFSFHVKFTKERRSNFVYVPAYEPQFYSH